ncbi:sodium:solute symporter family protein [Nitrosococcus wardiae]|uniref:sodium:solute symporter family protein n=1 Tax=Nitrosococcus wardiae TaxID=1814290 RepID=UPI001980D5F8|nr:sodium:solute symporter family protein [Nitrosococcus wardiae]
MDVVLLGVMAYMVIQFAIGVWVSRRNKSEDDYLLAGRRLGVGLTAFTVFATWFGAETVVGAAGNIYENGLSGGSGDPFGYAICLILLGLVFAVPLWRRRYTTFGDFFRQRYSSGVEKFFVLLVVPSSTLWAAAQIRAFGQVVSTISDLDVTVAITAAAAFVIIYTVAGGLLATAVTDLVQGLALMLGLGLLFFAVLNAAGGVEPALALVEPERLQLFGALEKSFLEVVEAWAIPICGATLAAEVIARILAAHSAETARLASVLGGTLYLAIGCIPVFIGLIGPGLLPGLEDAEQIIPQLAQQYLPTLFYVLFAGALISAILSTVDSALLAAASLISHNVVVPLRGSMSERAKIRSARLCVVLLGILAYVLAIRANGVYELIETAVAFGTAGVFVVGVLGLFTRIGGTPSALAALIAGSVLWFVGEYFAGWTTPYLLSLAGAALAYLGVAALEKIPIGKWQATRQET